MLKWELQHHLNICCKISFHSESQFDRVIGPDNQRIGPSDTEQVELFEGVILVALCMLPSSKLLRYYLDPQLITRLLFLVSFRHILFDANTAIEGNPPTGIKVNLRFSLTRSKRVTSPWHFFGTRAQGLHGDCG